MLFKFVNRFKAYWTIFLIFITFFSLVVLDVSAQDGSIIYLPLINREHDGSILDPTITTTPTKGTNNTPTPVPADTPTSTPVPTETNVSEQIPTPIGGEAGVALRSSLWEQTEIEVCWDTSGFITEKSWVRSAIEDTWERVSDLDFNNWQNCTSTNSGIRIAVGDVGPHVKELGTRIDGLEGGMVLNFEFTSWSESCASPESRRQYCIESIAVHEFGHAIGLAHEQNREDAPNWCREQAQGGHGDWYITGFDIDSIMNYCNPDWNNNGVLSDLDIETVQILYGSGGNGSGDADFVVVWQDDVDKNGFYQILGRGFASNGKEAFDDIVVNSDFSGQQLVPRIDIATDGSFVVVWEDDADQNGFYEIKARGFNADGTEKFGDITVNSDFRGQQRKPQIAVTTNGSFIVVWEDDVDKNGFYQIRARGFNADGTEKFSDFDVNSDFRGQQLNPQIAVATSGSFVVVWEDDVDENGFYQIRARGFNADGTEKFSDFDVNSDFRGQQLKPQVSMASNGAFVVIWEDDADKNDFYQIKARGFNSDGTEKFGDITVNSDFRGQQSNPQIAIASDQRFVVVWEDDADQNGLYQIKARGFYADGTERFNDLTVNNVAHGQQLKPHIDMSADGSFVVVWEDDRDGNDFYQIMGRGFYANGTEQFSDITINSDYRGQQIRPAIALK